MVRRSSWRQIWHNRWQMVTTYCYTKYNNIGIQTSRYLKYYDRLFYQPYITCPFWSPNLREELAVLSGLWNTRTLKLSHVEHVAYLNEWPFYFGGKKTVGDHYSDFRAYIAVNFKSYFAVDLQLLDTFFLNYYSQIKFLQSLHFL